MVAEPAPESLTAIEAEALSYKLIGFAEEVTQREWEVLVHTLRSAGIFLPRDRDEACGTRWRPFTG
jgi:hypothetical protein